MFLRHQVQFSALSLAAACTLAPAVGATTGSACFLPRVDFAVGSSPLSAVIGDINGDARPDLVVTNGGSNTVTVLLGDGSGHFARSDFAAGANPSSVAIGDLDRDSKPDLVITNLGTNSVSVLMGDGAGNFGPVTSYPTGLTPLSVAIDDLNGDGRPDVIVANAGQYPSDQGSLSVLLGDGGGGLGTRTDFTAGDRPRSVAIADLNSDGKADVVVANETSGTVFVFLGNGAGGFASHTELYVSYNAFPYFVAVGDLNRDGRVDLVVANHFAGTVSIFIGDGAGAFSRRDDVTAGFPTVQDSRNWPTAVAIGDLDGDGKPDLAVNRAGYAMNGISVLSGNGDGTFQVTSSLGTAGSTGTVLIQDLNGDGMLDLVGANDNPNSLSVLLQGEPPQTPIPVVYQPRFDYVIGKDIGSLKLVDLNGDGQLDLITANAGHMGTMSVLLGIGNGMLGPGVTYETGTGSFPNDFAVGDFNRDGFLDVAIPIWGESGIGVFLGLGDGTFGPKSVFAAGGVVAVAAGDFDRDGKLDLAGASDTPSGGVVVMHGNGDGTFQTSGAGYQAGGIAPTLVCGDLNGDDWADLVVAARDASSNRCFDPCYSVTVLVNNGNGAFSGQDYPLNQATSGAFAMGIGDLNGDGRADLAVRNYSCVSVMRGNGDGSFDLAAQFPCGLGQGVAVGDLNGDGRLDVAISSQGVGVSVLHGTGICILGRQADFATGNGPRSLAIGDLNGDGKLDLAVANTVDSTVSVLLQQELPVPTIVSLLSIHAEGNRIRLAWYAATNSGFIATVYRRTEDTDWVSLGKFMFDGTGYLRYEDATVHPGVRYGYRLGVLDGGVEADAGEAWATAEQLTLALEGPRPNPSLAGLVTLVFTLPVSAPAKLELIDVGGRRVALRDVGSLGAGRQSIAFGRNERIPPGIYLVRLVQGGRTVTRRVAVLQ